jgi:hypothetical protein
LSGREQVLLAKLLSLNSAHFDFGACNFTEKNMNRKDRREGLSKSGSGRVSTYRDTGLTHVYTLECNYNSGKSLNAIKAAAGPGSGRASPARDASVDPPRFTQFDFEGVGRGLMASLLDIEGINPWSRLTNSRHKSLDGVRQWVALYIERARRTGATRGGLVSMECGDVVEVDMGENPGVVEEEEQQQQEKEAEEQQGDSDSDGELAGKSVPRARKTPAVAAIRQVARKYPGRTSNHVKPAARNASASPRPHSAAASRIAALGTPRGQIIAGPADAHTLKPDIAAAMRRTGVTGPAGPDSLRHAVGGRMALANFGSERKGHRPGSGINSGFGGRARPVLQPGVRIRAANSGGPSGLLALAIA